MRSFLKICGWVFGLLLLAAVPAQGAAAPFSKAAAAYILKKDGAVLWSHKPHLRLPPASLTKVMTALLVIEKARLDEVVQVSSSAANETGTRLGLVAGERMRAGYLLAATMLQSANDACRLLAEHVGGSEREFVKMMNQRSREFGMHDTHFTNACGHDSPAHYSSAHDLLILAEAAMKNRTFAELTGKVYTRIDTEDRGRIFRLENKNELLGRYQGTRGVKTGYTLKAGKCLIAVAERNGSEVFLVLLNAPERWWDAVELLDRAFGPGGRKSIPQ